MTAGTDRLHEQLAAIGQALEAFDDQDAVTGAAGALLDDDAASPPAQQVAAGVTLHLAALTTEDGVRVTLQRPPGPLTAQLVDPASGAPLVERALDILLAALGEGWRRQRRRQRRRRAAGWGRCGLAAPGGRGRGQARGGAPGAVAGNPQAEGADPDQGGRAAPRRGADQPLTPTS